ncbi:T-cell activation Rho GTPase-activating protein-like [Oncorhynchus masou masou]|uniref:T-cell activation Rho GTPase-activating protein-like n=1 Tax=Oncorhynchus masou masou TaxID=90313 RepID=UPI003184501E
MKVLSNSITAKTLTGSGMDPFIEFPLVGSTKIPTLPRELCNAKATQPIEKGGNSKRSISILRKLKRSSTLNSMSSCPDTDSKSQLFGQPLSKICPEDGMLPKPITEILVLLWKKGPSTEGVFRTTCNNKTLKAIREQLNSGTEVEMDALPVVLLVGLLKSFLNELPGRLLVSELFETWMKALESEDVHQRGLQLKRVVDKLPGPNILLLRNLLCVFHHITKSGHANMMDANNLAVCIAPTLLQKDDMSLDVQTVDKVIELTKFLIEHCSEIFGKDILSLLGDPDEDSSESVLSQRHDSAYDSTDPDSEGDSMGSMQGEGESGSSSPSLLSACGMEHGTVPSCPTNAIFHTFTNKTPFNRRCSEPIIFPSAGKRNLARSHDDFSVEGRDVEEQPLKKQISNDSFLLPGHGAATRPAATLSLPKLGGSHPSCSSSCSLESTTSNASEGSVFTSSPLASPGCPRRAQSTHPRVDTVEVAKRRTQSMKVNSKAPMTTKNLGTFARISLKKGHLQKEKPFPCGTLQEDSQSEAEAPLRQKHPLSAMEAFQQVDSRLSLQPPSYKQAVQSVAQLALSDYGSMTVKAAAATLSRNSRPASMNANFMYSCTVNQYTDCFFQGTDSDDVTAVQQHSGGFRQRAMSESVSRARHETMSHHETVSRRCSQPVFEEYSYAKESYV